MTDLITLACVGISGALIGGLIVDRLAERRYQNILDAEKADAFRRGVHLGETNAKHYQRTFIRYVRVERLTPDEVMPGPYFEHPTS